MHDPPDPAGGQRPAGIAQLPKRCGDGLLDVIARLLQPGERRSRALRFSDDGLTDIELETAENVDRRESLDSEASLLRVQVQKISLGIPCQQLRQGIANRGALGLCILRSVDRADGFDDGIHHLIHRPAGQQRRIEWTPGCCRLTGGHTSERATQRARRRDGATETLRRCRRSAVSGPYLMAKAAAKVVRIASPREFAKTAPRADKTRRRRNRHWTWQCGSRRGGSRATRFTR